MTTRGARHRLPSRRKSQRFTITHGATPVHLTTGEYADGSLGEIFIDYAKQGTFSNDMMNAFAMAVSIGLQHGITLDTFQHTFRNFSMEPDIVRSIFAELELHYQLPKEEA